MLSKEPYTLQDKKVYGNLYKVYSTNLQRHF